MKRPRTGRGAFLLGVCCSILIMTRLAHEEKNYEAEVKRVPVSTVAPWWCNGDGKISYVTMRPAEPHVYTIHCTNGDVVTGASRNATSG